MEEGKVETNGPDQEFDEPIGGRNADRRGNDAGPRGGQFGSRAVEDVDPPRLALTTP